jgi:hypothetical protein
MPPHIPAQCTPPSRPIEEYREESAVRHLAMAKVGAGETAPRRYITLE